MKKIRILLIEDNKLLRDGIVSILKKQSDMQVVYTVYTFHYKKPE